MAALGLICVVASGSCWAQQSTSSTNEAHDKPKAQAKAAPAKAAAKPVAKPATRKTAEAKSTAKSTKDAKSSKQVAAKDAGKDKKAKADEDKSPSTAATEIAAEKAAPTKADAKVADARTEAAPPAGTMMGAYGQSLMRSPAAATAAVTTAAATGTAASLVAPTVSVTNTITTTTATTASLPPTALMGAAAGNANASESVARFLQQRGIVAQAQTSPTPSTPSVDAAAPGLLNRVRDNASNLVLSAMNFLGVPYKRGGNSVNNGFDCSGFTRHIFEMSVGLVLPRRADEQAKLSSLVPIKKEDLKPGDLVFFNTMRATFSHVGIYVGEGKFIHSPRVGGAVRVEDMREAYWAKRFTGARRADLNQANAGT